MRFEELRDAGRSPTPEELCAGCPELLEQVRRWLGRMEALEDLIGDTQVEAGPGPAARPLPGEAVAALRFRPVKFHAQGGLGEVHLAQDTELGRAVALKRMRPEHASHPDSRRRFLREAEVTARLEHPGVVPVYALGQGADGQPCYAMRFIEGESLKEAIERFHQADQQPGREAGERALALRELLGRFVAVCNTVAYAHSRGIIHRDLKPANIMLGKYGETLVVDWGLARPVERCEQDRAGGEETLVPASGDKDEGTRTGQAVGTPAYMSPEQAAGDWQNVGPASDTYSLGAVLFTLLTGQAPFGARNGADVFRRVRVGDFPRPRQIKAAVPPALEAVCLKAMALKPAARFSGALGLKAEVERWLADEPVSSYREPWLPRVARWARRHKPLVTGTGTLFLVALLLAGLGLLWRQRQRSAVAEDLHLAERLQREERWGGSAAGLGTRRRARE
jgi:serine/threonine-protein kinase